MARVLVYTDGGLGASEACVAMTVRELRRTLSWLGSEEPRRERLELEKTNAAAILAGDLEHTCRLLVMPGGRDLPYCSALNGAGNERIRRFVRAGGSYLGVCAGAYYAAGRVEFSTGDPAMEVRGSRELKFYPGVARGPVFPGFQYDDHSGARASCISLRKSSSPLAGLINTHSSLPVYYNGGCYFHKDNVLTENCTDTDFADNFEVLATYDTPPQASDIGQLDGPLSDGPALFPDTPAAIVSLKHGMGRVVLSGVHIESSPASLSEVYSGDPYLGPILETLRATESKRKDLFNNIIRYLLQ